MNEPNDPNVTTDLPSRPAGALDSLSIVPPALTDVTLERTPTTDAENPATPSHQPPTLSRIGDEPSEHDEEESFEFLQPSTLPDSLGRLGHYEILHVLGRGGCGVVFRAFDDRLQRVVAIKVMARQIAMLPTVRRRFVREARTSAAVRHKNVVQVFEVAEQPLPYLVMEFIPGETLQQKLARTGPLEVSEVLSIGREIAEGLAAAHAKNLIHRDIKPGNVLIEDGPPKRVKITDFGLARASDDASISQSGQIIGTPMFMAPEQALGHDIDQRADLFSLGSVLYQMVTGCAPFQAPSTLAVLGRVAEDDARPIQEIVPETPKWLCDIIVKLHAKNPDDRFQSARELADVLAECEAQHQVQAKNFSRILRRTPQRSRRWKWAVAAALLLPFLVLTLTETTRVTHIFRGRPAPANPKTPESEPTALVEKQEPMPIPDASIDNAQPKKQLPTEVEKPIEKKPPMVVAEPEENPFKKATVGDFADYTMNQVSNGQKFGGKIRIEVVAKTDRTARIRMIRILFNQFMPYPEHEIDLTKPYDPTKTGFLPLGAQKLGSGTEKIKVGNKEYETSWTTMRFKGKVGTLDTQTTAKFWTSRTVPVGALVKMESTNLAITGAKNFESKVTMEFSVSGHKISPVEARSFAARGDWKSAAAEYARMFAAHPMEDGEHGFECACVLLLSGDRPGYRKICA